MPDAEMPAALAATPLGDRMRTYMHHLRTCARFLTAADLASIWAPSNPRFPLYLDEIARNGERIAGFTVTAYESTLPHAGVAFLRDPSGRDWRCCVVIDDQPPHLILGSAVFPSPPGVVAREARDTDVAVLREIERMTPIVIGDAKIFYDRGEDYFAGERLMGDVEMFVVERDGRVVGMAGRSFPPVRIAGTVSKGMYSHRLRLLPEAQGEGVQGPLNARGMEGGVVQMHAGHVSYAFVAEGNVAALRRMEPERLWSVGASRIVIDTANAAGDFTGRDASAADAGMLIGRFNSLHEREEMFVPYTVESLTQRLQREPAAYTFTDIAVGEHAAVGVWRAGLGVHREAGGAATDDVRALVLDYGCEPGAELELIALLRAACRQLAEHGTTELSIFSSAPSPLFPLLSALAKRIEPYIVACRTPPGPALDQRGVYVDQLYF